MKKKLLLVFIFLISFIVFAIALMPANFALNIASKYLPKQLQIGAVSGTIWQGKANVVSYQNIHVNRVMWDLNPWSLVSAKLAGKVNLGNVREKSAPYGKINFELGLFNQQVSLNNSKLRVPAPLIASQVRLPFPVQSKGTLELTIAQAVTGKPYCEQLQGQVETKELSVMGLQGWIDVDTIKGKLSCKSGALALLVNEQNELGLELDAELGDAQPKVTAFIKPAPSMPKQVHDGVKFLGRPDEQGRYQIRL